MRPTSWLPLAAMALLVGLTLWLEQLVQLPSARALAQGMVVNNRSRTLQLERVKATYQPPKKAGAP